MNTKVKNENFILIQGYMINDFNLKGNELLIYAIISGFSQEENQVFSGSLQYLAEWTNSTKQGVMKNLKSLVEKKLIGKNEKYINGVKFCEYYATKFTGVCNKVNGGMQQSLIGGIKQSLTNNIDLDNIDNTIVNNKEKKFKKPSIEEVQQYCFERNNNIDAEHFIDYYDANGWKVGKNPMKDWKAAIRTWEKRNNGGNNNASSKGTAKQDLSKYDR
jgi:hypothetical protein